MFKRKYEREIYTSQQKNSLTRFLCSSETSQFERTEVESFKNIKTTEASKSIVLSGIEGNKKKKRINQF